MRLLGWVLIHYDWCPLKKRKRHQGCTCAEGRHVKRRGGCPTAVGRPEDTVTGRVGVSTPLGQEDACASCSSGARCDGALGRLRGHRA